MEDENKKKAIGKFIEKVTKVITKVAGLVISVIMNLSTTTLIVIAVLILISSIDYIINQHDGSRDDDNSGNVGHVVSKTITSETTPKNIVEKNGEYGYNIDLDEKVKQVIEDLKEDFKQAIESNR